MTLPVFMPIKIQPKGLIIMSKKVAIGCDHGGFDLMLKITEKKERELWSSWQTDWQTKL